MDGKIPLDKHDGFSADYPGFARGLFVMEHMGAKIYHIDAKGMASMMLEVPDGQGNRPSGSFYRKANGNWVITQAASGSELSPEGKVVFTWKSQGRVIRLCKPLRNGNYLIAQTSLSSGKKGDWGGNLSVAGGHPQIVEVTSRGEVIRTMELEYEARADEYQVYQIRGTQPLSNGNVLVAHQQRGVVNEYGPEGRFLKTIFAFHREKQGEPVSVYRCERGHTVVGTVEGIRAGVFEIDAAGQIVWELRPADIPDAVLWYPCMVEKLSSGHYLIANHRGHNKDWKGFPVIEVSPEKQIVRAITDWRTIPAALWARPCIAKS